MANCKGTKTDGNSKIVCGGTLYKCLNCGTVGCTNNNCNNKKFEGTKCLSCGSNVTRLA